MGHMYRRTIQRAAIVLAVALGAALAQTPPPKLPSFEVATIRAAPSIQELIPLIQSGKAKLGMMVDEGRVDMGFTSPADMLRIGFRVKQYQVIGPDWMMQQRFEIQATIPAGVSKDQVPEMIQSLLVDRFKLAYHHEKRDLPVYALIVGKGGLKLEAASSTPDAPLPDTAGGMTVGTEKGPMKIVQDGKGGAVMQGGQFGGTVRYSVGAAGMHLEITKATIGELVDLLTTLVDKPVIDMTGLTGAYQVSMDLPIEDLIVLAQKQAAQLGLQLPAAAPQAPGANPADLASTPGGAAIFQSVEKMGLKLDARKAPVDAIIVDHLEKTPTEN